MDHKLQSALRRQLAQPAQPGCVEWARCVDKSIRSRFPGSHGPRLDAIRDNTQLSPEVSSFRWTALLDARGTPKPLDGPIGRLQDLEHGSRLWEIAVSVRGPLLTARAWSASAKGWEPRQDPDPDLAAWAQSIANCCNLGYVEAASLIQWSIEPSELTDEMWLRLDFEENPTAFQLLFYEI